MPRDPRPPEADLVLLVEDSPSDVEAVRRVLEREYPGTRLECVADGPGAVVRLSDEHGERPTLVLLDLNVPGLPGARVLATARSRPTLDGVPIVVLTSSTDQRDITASYDAGATSYLFKPVDLALFQVVLRGTFDHWLARTRRG